MKLSNRFLKIAGASAIVTAITTSAIHLLPMLWAGTNSFEEQLRLPHNPIYIARLWIVLIHCLLVVVSMYAVGALRAHDEPVLVSFGFLGFSVFAFTEMLRTSLGIFALNRAWRAGYATTTDETARAALRATIGAFSGINDALFFLFFTAFSIGVFCYGLALLSSNKGVDRKVGLLFLVWALLNFPGLVALITNDQTITKYFEWVGPYFQPMARFIIGVWLLRVSKSRNMAQAA